VKHDYFTTKQRKRISESFLLSGGMATIILLFFGYNYSMTYFKDRPDFPQRELIMYTNLSFVTMYAKVGHWHTQWSANCHNQYDILENFTEACKLGEPQVKQQL